LGEGDALGWSSRRPDASEASPKLKKNPGDWVRLKTYPKGRERSPCTMHTWALNVSRLPRRHHLNASARFPSTYRSGESVKNWKSATGQRRAAALALGWHACTCSSALISRLRSRGRSRGDRWEIEGRLMRDRGGATIATIDAGARHATRTARQVELGRRR